MGTPPWESTGEASPWGGSLWGEPQFMSHELPPKIVKIARDPVEEGSFYSRMASGLSFFPAPYHCLLLEVLLDNPHTPHSVWIPLSLQQLSETPGCVWS